MSTEVTSDRVSHPGGVPIEILLIEDNEGDIVLTQEGFRDAKVCNVLHVVRDGPSALSFLRKEGQYSDKLRPGLVLLDLNLPGMSGREILRQIKSDDELKSIPVVILTTSDRPKDVQETYALHANSFVTKPIDFYKFTEMIQKLGKYWLTVVKLPAQ